MRRAVAIAILALLAACSSDESTPALFGGFEPQDTAAIVFDPVVCNVPGVGIASVSGIAVLQSSSTETCAIAQETGLCGMAASSSALVVVALRGVPGDGGVAAAGPGTYRVRTSPPSGPFLAAMGDADQVDAECNPAGADPGGLIGGSITFSTVDPERVTGSMSLRFEDAGYEDTFESSICPVSFDLCAVLSPCGDYVCVQPT